MSENSYAFAVAQVRSYENALLNKNLYEQILTAESEKDVWDILAARGWDIPENINDAEEVLSREQQNVWELLNGLAGKAPEMRIFTVKNDYHNLKTAIKAFVSDTSSDENFLYPASVDVSVIKTAVSEKKYDLLPKRMQSAAREAYDVLVASGDGQTADIIIDRYTLEELLETGETSESEMVKKYCILTVEYSDIKTAFRGAATGKGDDFYERSLCGSNLLDKNLLARAAKKGTDEVLNYLTSAGYTKEASALKVSVFEFEKWYDNEVAYILGDADFINFGIEPLISYGFKKETEIKNIRIALTCKRMGADRSVTEERMRISDV